MDRIQSAGNRSFPARFVRYHPQQTLARSVDLKGYPSVPSSIETVQSLHQTEMLPEGSRQSAQEVEPIVR